MDAENKTPFKVKDVTRNIKKAVVAGSLEELRSKVAEKFDKHAEQATIHLDSDGTEVDDEEYFRTLDANSELIAVFPGEHWIDPSNYVMVTSHHENNDTIDASTDALRLQKLVGELQHNLCNISMLNDADLESLSNMDPNSLVDITGKELIEQMKDAGRPLCAKRNASDRVNLLKMLKDGAIFCSERYPEEAEAIDMEIRKQLSLDTETGMTINDTNTTTTTATTTTTTTLRRTVIIDNIINTKTIEQVQNSIDDQRNRNDIDSHNANTTITTIPTIKIQATATTATTNAASNNKNHSNNDI